MFKKKNRKMGLVLSQMDGTEHIFGKAVETTTLPNEYSFKSFLPAILDQGEDSICVPCSLSAYLNWKENLKTGEQKDNKVDYFEIYGIRTNDGEGMTFKEALHYLRHHGVSSKAGELKINEYALVKDSSTLKNAIIMNGPCVGALPVYNFGKEFWNKGRNDEFYGYHAISIVGYNSDGFIIRNSWGTGYADHGYTLIQYGDYDKFIEVWTVID